METPTRRAQRLLLKTDKSVISAVEQVMGLFRTNAEGLITKEAYMEIHVKILRALIPAFKGDYAAVGEVLWFTSIQETDWSRRTGSWMPVVQLHCLVPPSFRPFSILLIFGPSLVTRASTPHLSKLF